MIRINLLPVKAAKRQDGQRQLVGGALLFGLALVGLLVFHAAAAAESAAIRVHNRTVNDTIEALKKEIGDYDLVKGQRDELIKQRDAIRRLEANRAGPVWMMLELSDILSKGKGKKEGYEELVKRDADAGINTNWDPRGVWLLGYEEKAHQVKIKGAAKSDEDVVELLKRLKLSPFFADVHGQPTQPQHDSKLNVAYVTFDVTCKVTY